jgi:hypothetical protein
MPVFYQYILQVGERNIVLSKKSPAKIHCFKIIWVHFRFKLFSRLSAQNCIKHILPSLFYNF